jgi:nicotinamidase-related amidase/alkylated DNA repair dioxygenase AlkB
MMALLDLISQNQPHFRTNQALLVIGLQNDFIQPDGRLPVSTRNGFLERINVFAPKFRDAFSNVIWVQTLYEADRLANDPATGEGDAVVVGGLVDGVESSTDDDEDLPKDLLPQTQSRSSRNKQRALDLLKKVSTRRRVAPREAASEASQSAPGEDEELFLLRTPKKAPACLPKTPGAEFVDSVKANIAPSDCVLATTNYSAFLGTKLLQHLRGRLVTELFICGCLTNVSVLATVIDAVRHGIKINVIGDCLGFRKQNRHDEALKRMVEFFDADIVNSLDVLRKNEPDEPQQHPEENSNSAAVDDELEGLVAKLNIRTGSRNSQAGSSPAIAVNGQQRRESEASRAESHLSDEQFAEKLAQGAKPIKEDTPATLTQNLVKSRIRMRSRTDKSKKVAEKPKRKEADKKPEASPGSTAAEPAAQPLNPLNVRAAESAVDKIARKPGIAKAESSDKLRPSPARQPLKSSFSHPALGNTMDKTSSHVTRLTSGPSQSGDSNVTATTNPPKSPARTQIPIEASESGSASSSVHNTPIMSKKLQSLATLPVLRPGDRIAEGDSRIIYDFFPATFRHSTDTSKPLQGLIFRQLYNEVRWQKMFHQQGEVPRLVCCQGEFGADGSMPVYRHPSDQALPLLHFSPKVQVIRKQAEKLVGHPLNHVLVQLYRTGNDYISEHSDKTLDIVRGSSIVNVSFGAQRTMRLRTKKSPKSNESEENEERNTQRVAMPHNSMFVLGLESNKKWLHGINADKRPAAERSEEEKAYSGIRISLTFRHIGTFLDAENSTIWGQGATSKEQRDAQEVINDDEDENEKMIQAFSQENHHSDFDWDEWYGDGFDVLHFRDAPEDVPILYASNLVAETNMVKVFLWEQKINHIVIESPADDNEYDYDRRICYRDNDVNHTEVSLVVAIVTYLNHYHPLDRDDRGRSGLASTFEVFVHVATALRHWNNRHVPESLAAFVNSLDSLEERQTFGLGPFAAGRRFSIGDCSVWPFLDQIVGEWEGWSEERYPTLTEYYRMLWKKKKSTLSKLRPQLPEIRKEAVVDDDEEDDE